VFAAVFVLSPVAASCSRASSPPGGLLVAMDLDPSLDPARVASLEVTVGSSDGGADYRTSGFTIDDASGPGHTRFPTSFAVVSNGDPGASVGFVLSVSDRTHALDTDRYDVVDVPTDRVVELRVLFGASCAGRAPSASGVVSCPLGGCAWKGDHWLCDAGSLEPPDTDAGWPRDDAGDATVAQDADAASTAAPDGTAADAMNDAAPDAAADAPADAPADAALVTTCDPACVEYNHCVQGRCARLPPSCLGGGPGVGANCGASGADDCCAIDEVVGGTFLRDYDGHGETFTGAQATISTFGLDRYEVTVGRFRRFVAAASATPPWVPSESDGRHLHLNGGQGLANVDAPPAYEQGWISAWDAHLPATKADWDARLRDAGCTGDGASTVVPDWTSDADAGDDVNENRPITCVDW
jgi:hypothetical protein